MFPASTIPEESINNRVIIANANDVAALKLNNAPVVMVQNLHPSRHSAFPSIIIAE
jgi:hypothetical protein